MSMRLQVTKSKAAKAKTPKKAPAAKKSKVVKKQAAPKAEGAYLLKESAMSCVMHSLHCANTVEGDPFRTWLSVDV